MWQTALCSTDIHAPALILNRFLSMLGRKLPKLSSCKAVCWAWWSQESCTVTSHGLCSRCLAENKTAINTPGVEVKERKWRTRRFLVQRYIAKRAKLTAGFAFWEHRTNTAFDWWLWSNWQNQSLYLWCLSAITRLGNQPCLQRLYPHPEGRVGRR